MSDHSMPDQTDSPYCCRGEHYEPEPGAEATAWAAVREEPRGLTDAEKAVEAVLYKLRWAKSATEDDGCGCGGGFRDSAEARAVVAAVRPLIASEVLREEARYLYDHRRDDDAAYDLWRMYEAGGPEWLASRANAALSRPTAEEAK